MHLGFNHPIILNSFITSFVNTLYCHSFASDLFTMCSLFLSPNTSLQTPQKPPPEQKTEDPIALETPCVKLQRVIPQGLGVPPHWSSFQEGRESSPMEEIPSPLLCSAHQVPLSCLKGNESSREREKIATKNIKHSQDRRYKMRLCEPKSQIQGRPKSESSAKGNEKAGLENWALRFKALGGSPSQNSLTAPDSHNQPFFLISSNYYFALKSCCTLECF